MKCASSNGEATFGHLGRRADRRDRAYFAGALTMPLGLKQDERLVANRSIDAESYQQYLRARLLMRALAAPQAIEILEPLVLAQSRLCARLGSFGVRLCLLRPPSKRCGETPQNGGVFPKAEAAARRAIQLDSNLADAYVALSSMQRIRGKLLAAEELDLKALAVDPNSPDALGQYMIFLSIVGRRMEAPAMAEQLLTLEPWVPAYTRI